MGIFILLIFTVAIFYNTNQVTITGAESVEEERQVRSQLLEIAANPRLANVKDVLITRNLDEIDIDDKSKLLQIKIPDGRIITYIGSSDISPITPRFTPIGSCNELAGKICHTETLEDGSEIQYMCSTFACSCTHQNGDANC